MTGALVAFLSACLAGLGVGSGGFYLLYLTDGAGLAQYTAQGVNLVFFAVATLSSSLVSWQMHRLSLPRLFAILLLGIPGAALGALTTLFIPPLIARRGLALLLLAGGVLTLRKTLAHRKQASEKKPSHPL